LFVSDADREHWEQQIHDVLAAELPFEVRGYSTHFRPFERSKAHFGRLGHLVQRSKRPINHGVSVLIAAEASKLLYIFQCSVWCRRASKWQRASRVPSTRMACTC
jgi:hypothetical protein